MKTPPPCPSCGKPDWCSTSPDGKHIHCTRFNGSVPDGMRRVGTSRNGAVVMEKNTEGAS